MNAFIRLLYALLIAVAVVVFVGVSINSLYPGPKMPEYPQMYYPGDVSSNPDSQKQQKDYDSKYKVFRDTQKKYQRNVSAIAVGVAVIAVAGGLWYMRRNEIIGEGIALGGVGVSIYSVITAVVADNRVMRLIAVTMLLASAILLVQRRFIENIPVKK